MDKKELNDLIDRVVLTGPGGVDKIKKILKELVSESDDSGSDDGSGCKCLAPMIVEGTVDAQDNFIPASGAHTWAEAYDHMLNGGLVYFLFTENGASTGCQLATACFSDAIESLYSHWVNPDSLIVPGQDGPTVPIS